ncbi:hypothetical protein AGMMS49965_18770 [Bacteroidia bacterium]|nr:hypothetical protein AGMMS49965_18770 [Bacteroidia bacterium]
MKHLKMSLSDKLLISMNMDTEEILTAMRKVYGSKLYQEGKLTLSQSAELSGTDIYEFMSFLTGSGVPVIDYRAEELVNELNQF